MHVATISLEYQVSLPLPIPENTNLNYKLGVAVACAIKVALEKHDISGNIVLLGTPGNALSFCHRFRPSQLVLLFL